MSLTWLDRDLTNRAYAWRLERADGLALGFTSHDRDIVIDNFRYRSAPGMIPSSIALSDSLDIDSVEVEGVMTVDAITDADLESGRWNGARLEISIVNWEAPEEDAVHLITGEFGDIARFGDGFRVEILGPTSFLDAAVAPLTSPGCRARFCDRECKLSLHAHQLELTITEVEAARLRIEGLAGAAADFAFGEIRWLTGPNCGLESAIIRGQNSDIWLADPPGFAVKAGDRVQLTAGCDKNLSTCRDRFENMVNFRGEPYLPGNDLLTRYPGA